MRWTRPLVESEKTPNGEPGPEVRLLFGVYVISQRRFLPRANASNSKRIATNYANYAKTATTGQVNSEETTKTMNGINKIFLVPLRHFLLRRFALRPSLLALRLFTVTRNLN